MKTHRKFNAVVSIFLCLLLAASVLPMTVFAAVNVDAEQLPAGMKLITKTDYAIAPGVEESQIIFNNADGSHQNMGYAVSIDLKGSASIIASYKNQDGTTPGMQNVRDQARAAERKRGVNVVAGVNADFFNMANGAPCGFLVMDGKSYFNSSTYEPYFAILNNGTAVIRGPEVPISDVKEAVGLNPILVQNGQVVLSDNSSYSTSYQPRTVVGIKEDGSVVLFVNDGRNAPKSYGMTMLELAHVMLSMGCVSAGNLDGGGSTTYLSQHEGETELVCRNNPSDRIERNVSSALLVTSSAVATGEFGHANLEPNNEVYTPESQVSFTAAGVDTAGFAMALPEGGTFKLADSSYGSIDESGLFVSNGKTGTVTVNYEAGGKVIGSTDIEIQNPDSITFSTDEISLGFEAQTDFGLSLRYQARDVHMKDGDIIWSATDAESGEDCLSKIGTIENNILTTPDGVTLTANVTATYRYMEGLSASIKAIIGMLPTVVWDFEDVERFTPDGYDEEGNLISEFATYTAGHGETASAKVVSIYDDEPVRFGEHSLKLNYDFTQAQDTTCGAYYGMSEMIEVPGTPTGFGVWVYAPEGTENFWLRGYIYNNNDFTKATPVDFTLQTGDVKPGTSPAGIYWTGWKYCEADLSLIQPPYHLFPKQTFRLMYVPGISMGQKTKGSIYLDNLQFVYGANTDDVYAPVIDSMTVNNEEIVDNETVVSTDTITLTSYFHDVEDKYMTGVEVVRMYLDGKEVTERSEFVPTLGDGKAGLYEVTLPDGWHTVEFVARDGFGNETSEIRHFKVDASSSHPRVYTEPQTEFPVLCREYPIEVKTSVAEELSSVDFTVATDQYFTDYEISFDSAYTGNSSYNAKTHTLTVHAEKSGDASSDTIATISYTVPATLTEGSQFTYEINGTFTHTAESAAIASFSSGKISLPVKAAYSISAEPMLVGRTGTIHVSDVDGNAAANVPVYKEDGTSLGETDAQGDLVTDAITATIGNVKVYAEKDGDRSFMYTISVNAVPENLTEALPSFVTSPAVQDSSTSKAVTWLANPEKTQARAIMQLAVKSDYDAKGESAFVDYEGTSQVLNFATTMNAARANRVTATGLQPAVEYVYRVGDGEVWSETATFTLDRLNGDTNFFVVGDVQAVDLAQTKRMMQTLAASDKDYLFSIQTGDSVDNAGSFDYWTQLLTIYGSDVLEDIDTIHVLGNHEFEGDLSGTNASAIYNLPGPGRAGHYSVQYGNVYVAVINYTVTADQLQEALDWLVEDAQASTARWKILTMHQPPYYTNPTGGSDYINRLVPSAAEAAGIDVVFSGHDHSYARTKPMKGGAVDEENGVTYFISGSTGEKSYDIVNNPSFNFAALSDEFNIAYLSVSAKNDSLTVEAHDIDANGNDMIIDSYSKEKESECSRNGHSYVWEGDLLTCSVCGYYVPSENYTGLVTDSSTGKKVYLYLGSPRKGTWQTVGDDIYYFGADGQAVTGKQKITDVIKDSAFNGKTTLEYTFGSDGKLVRGAVVSKDNNKYYYLAGVRQTGWFEIDGGWYFFYIYGSGANYGKLLTGKFTVARQHTYTTDKNGKLIRGDFCSEGDGKRYYWAGVPVTGWWTIDGTEYYFDPDNFAYMATDTAIIDGEIYAFSYDGLYLHKGEHNRVLKEHKDATCTKDGYDLYVCTYDGEEHDEYAKIYKATGHTDKNEDGYCDVCGTNTWSIFYRILMFFERILDFLSALLGK